MISTFSSLFTRLNDGDKSTNTFSSFSTVFLSCAIEVPIKCCWSANSHSHWHSPANSPVIDSRLVQNRFLNKQNNKFLFFENSVVTCRYKEYILWPEDSRSGCFAIAQTNKQTFMIFPRPYKFNSESKFIFQA